MAVSTAADAHNCPGTSRARSAPAAPPARVDVHRRDDHWHVRNAGADIAVPTHSHLGREQLAGDAAALQKQ